MHWRKRSAARSAQPVQPLSSPQSPNWANEHKIVLMGISEAGKTTVRNQTRLISSPIFDSYEYDACRELLWSTLVRNFTLVLDYLDEVSNSTFWVQNRDVVEAAKALVYSEAKSTWDVRSSLPVINALEILWSEPPFQSVLKAGPRIGLSDNLIYLYENMRRSLSTEWTPSNNDILNIRVMTLGVSYVTVFRGGETFRIYDIPGERGGRSKWVHSFKGDQVRCAMFIASLTGYCAFVEQGEPDVTQMTEALHVFKDMVDSEWLPQTIFALVLTKLDLFSETIRNCPLEMYDSDFVPPPPGTDATGFRLAHIANKFVAIAKAKNRILQVHCINAVSTASQACLESTLRFTSSTVPERPSSGVGELEPCLHCQMGDLYIGDRFEANTGYVQIYASGGLAQQSDADGLSILDGESLVNDGDEDWEAVTDTDTLVGYHSADDESRPSTPRPHPSAGLERNSGDSDTSEIDPSHPVDWSALNVMTHTGRAI